MGYRALASRSTVLTKYIGCSTRAGALTRLAASGGWGRLLGRRSPQSLVARWGLRRPRCAILLSLVLC